MKKNWVTQRKILSFGLGLFLLATKGQASSECHFHLSQSLSKEALDSLVSAHSSGHYLVEILKKTVGDTPKI